jgi:hypothetical protein
MVLHKEKPCTGRIRGLNLAKVRHTTVQLANCSFRVVRKLMLKEYSVTGKHGIACINVT